MGRVRRALCCAARGSAPRAEGAASGLARGGSGSRLPAHRLSQKRSAGSCLEFGGLSGGGVRGSGRQRGLQGGAGRGKAAVAGEAAAGQKGAGEGGASRGVAAAAQAALACVTRPAALLNG